jgi:hypothetical protein
LLQTRPGVSDTTQQTITEGGGGVETAGRRPAVFVAVLMAAASAGGLLVDGLYRDPAEVAALLRGYDAVTLTVAVPLLAATTLPALRTSVRAALVRIGMLVYALYTYATYVFGTVFNDVFLLHVAVFSTSLSAVVLSLTRLDVAEVGSRFRARTPARLVGGLLAFLAVGLAGMWVFYSLRFAVTGAFPEESDLLLPASAVHLAYALDLSLLVPAYALAAVLVWRRAAWGYVLATVLLVSGTVHQLAYLVALVSQALAGVPGATAFDPLEIPIVVAFLLGAGLLLANLTAGRAPAHTSQVTRALGQHAAQTRA